jgi:hypothetical protein
MAGMSTAKTDANYNGVKNARKAAEKVPNKPRVNHQKASKKAAAAAAAAAAPKVEPIQAQAPKSTPAEEAHKTETSNIKMESGDSRPEPAASSTGKAQTAPEDPSAKKSKGLLDTMKGDYDTTKNFLGETAGILSGEAGKAEAEMGVSSGKSKFDQIKKKSGDYLNDMGGGSKILGGAKIAGYMVGASVLVDMLNPFDDD